MVANADKVAVEVETRLNAAAARTAEAQFDQSMNRITASAGKAEKQIAASAERMGGSFMDARTRTRQLGVQIDQLGASLASGISPFVVLSQQAGDFAYVLGGTQGVAGRLASFFSGPWGAALLTGSLLLAGFITREKERAATLEDTLDKMRKQHAQSQLNEQADRIWQRTIDGLTASMQKRNEELKKTLQTDIQAEQASRNAAKAELERFKARRFEVAREFNELQSKTGSRNIQGESERRLAALQAELTNLNNLIATAEQNVRLAEGIISQRNVENALDPVKRATDAYSVALGNLNKQLEKNQITQAAYDRQLLAAAKARDAAIEAANKARRSSGAPEFETTAFGRPVAGGRVTGVLGEQRPGHRHGGVDIAVPVGTPVSAAAGGVVIESGNVPGYGNVIVIDHGRGTISRYAHLSQLGAARGAVVDAGQQIGLSGGAPGAPGAGNSRGAHLHYEVRRGGRPVDPFGRYPTDQLGANSRSDELARRAEAEANKALAQQARYENEMAQLGQQLVAAQRGRLETVTEQLEAKQAEITAERDQRVASYEQAAQQGQITEANAQLLIAKAQQVAAAKALALADDEMHRRGQLEIQLSVARQEARIDQLQFEQDQARTAEERRVAALTLLDAETQLQRIRLQQVVDATVAGTAEHEIALLKLDQLDAERGRRAQAINRNPANMSPGGRYLDELNQSAGQIGETIEEGAVGAFKQLNQQIAGAILGTGSLEDAWENMGNTILSMLAEIAIQQLLIKPMAQLLFGSQGGGGFGGGLGGLFGSIAGIFGGGSTGGGMSSAGNSLGWSSWIGGPKASGGSVMGGRGYWVGEQGPEWFQPAGNGQIVPNHALARHGGNSPGTVEVVVTAGEYFDARVGRVTGPVIAKASVQAARGGSVLARQDMGKQAMHRLE